MFCSKCGKTLDTDDRFCPSCGASIKTTEMIDTKKNSTKSKPDTPRKLEIVLKIGIIIFTSLSLVCHIIELLSFSIYEHPVSPPQIILRYVHILLCILLLLVMIFSSKLENKITSCFIWILLISITLYEPIYLIADLLDAHSYLYLDNSLSAFIGILLDYVCTKIFIPYTTLTSFPLVTFELICYILTLITIHRNKKIIGRIFCSIWLGLCVYNYFSLFIYNLCEIQASPAYISIFRLGDIFDSLTFYLFMIRALIKTSYKTTSTYGG